MILSLGAPLGEYLPRVPGWPLLAQGFAASLSLLAYAVAGIQIRLRGFQAGVERI